MNSRTRPPVLNALSDATVEINIANTSRAISPRTWNLLELILNQSKILKLSLSASVSSRRYFSDSALLILPHSTLCFWYCSCHAFPEISNVLLSGTIGNGEWDLIELLVWYSLNNETRYDFTSSLILHPCTSPYIFTSTNGT